MHVGSLGATVSDLPGAEEAGGSTRSEGDTLSPASSPLRPRGTQPGSLGAIIQTYNAESTRRINRMIGVRENHIWQRNYYERIIRNEREYEAIRQYIINNAIQWAVDRENPVRW